MSAEEMVRVARLLRNERALAYLSRQLAIMSVCDCDSTARLFFTGSKCAPPP